MRVAVLIRRFKPDVGDDTVDEKARGDGGPDKS